MGQKAKKITDKQYQHARKMAFAKSIDGLPKKVAQWVDDSVLLGSRYLFTHRENGVRYGHCTHCHKDVVLELGRTFTPADEENIYRRHKEIGFCPACKSTVEFRDSGRGRKYMYDQKYILFATKLRDGGILVRAGFVERDYRLDYTTVKTNFFEEYRVYYTTGVDAGWAKRWSYGFHGWEKNWERMATIPEPSSKQPWYTDEKNYAENHYYGFNDETFKNTNLQYAQMSAYMENFGGNPCGWLDTYVKYPVLTEKLVKEGFIRLAVNDSWTNGVVNRRAKTVSAALGLTKKELRELPEKTRDAVLYAQLAKKTGYPVEALKAQGASAGPLEAAPPRRMGAGRRASAAAEEDARTRAENALLQAMAQSREATLAAVEDGAVELLPGGARSRMAAEIIAAYAADAAPNCARIIAAMPEDEAGQLAGVFREDAAAADPVRVVRDCARRIRRFECKQQIDALTQRLSGGTLPAAEREALMQQIQQLTRQLRG